MIMHPTSRSTRRRFLTSAAAASAAVALPKIAWPQPAKATAGVFHAGAALADITPPLGMPSASVIVQGGPIVEIHDPLHARALVLDDGQTKLALVVCDLRMISREVFDRAKRLIAERTAIPYECVLACATHTHAAPPAIGLWSDELTMRFEQTVSERIAEAVAAADSRLAPARIGWGAARKPELTVNRRWFMKPGAIPPNPFGQQTDQVLMGGQNNPDRIRPAGPVDPEISVVSLVHDDGRPLAVLANYGIHYVGGYQSAHISADYFGLIHGRLTKLLEAKEGDGFVGIMSNGTSGDVVTAGVRGSRPWTRMAEVADDVAADVARVVSTIDYRADVSLDVRTRELELALRQPSQERLRWANEVWSSAQSKLAAGKAPTRPEIYAREAIFISQQPRTVQVLLQAMRIGDLGIAAVGCEVFAETGLAIKSGSALKPTFTMELANGYHGYLPTREQHALGGYETWLARSSSLEVDAESKIRAGLIELLGEVQ